MSTDHLAAARQRVAEMTACGTGTADALASVLAEALEAKAAIVRRPAWKEGAMWPQMAELLDEIKLFVASQTAPLQTRLDALADRRTMSFVGSFDPAHQYSAGDVVQKNSGLFVALIDTTEIPGSSSAWRNVGAAK